LTNINRAKQECVNEHEQNTIGGDKEHQQNIVNKCQQTPTECNKRSAPSTGKTQQGNVDEHHLSTTTKCQQASIKYNNGAQMNTNKTQQKNANEYS
jgi:hypothetical protein